MDIQALQRFSAGSANDDTHKHLWIEGASQFIPQLNQLLTHTRYVPTILPIAHFLNANHTEADAWVLGNILKCHLSDKSTTHAYHILYSYIFNELGREAPLKLLEIGLGTNNPALISSMGSTGRPGASLYAFREYLPNASLYGGDIDQNILFEYDRITTRYVDQMKQNTLEVFDGLYDVIIDDGLHSIGANFNTLLFALKHLKVGGWFIVEDIQLIDNFNVIEFILRSTGKYDTYMIDAKGYMFSIKKLRD
jgi:hypothetical protein